MGAPPSGRTLFLLDTWYNPASGASSILYDPTIPNEHKTVVKEKTVKQTFAALGRADEYGIEMHTTEDSLCEISNGSGLP